MRDKYLHLLTSKEAGKKLTLSSNFTYASIYFFAVRSQHFFYLCLIGHTYLEFAGNFMRYAGMYLVYLQLLDLGVGLALLFDHKNFLNYQNLRISALRCWYTYLHISNGLYVNTVILPNRLWHAVTSSSFKVQTWSLLRANSRSFTSYNLKLYSCSSWCCW